MIAHLPQFLDQKKYFVNLILKNHHSDDVLIRMNISGKLEVDSVKAKTFSTISKNWKTKKLLSITAVAAATQRPLYINGRSIVHLQSTTWQFLTTAVLNIRGICNFYIF